MNSPITERQARNPAKTPDIADGRLRAHFETITNGRAENLRALIATTGWGPTRLSVLAIPGEGTDLEERRESASRALQILIQDKLKRNRPELPEGLYDAVAKAIDNNFELLTREQVQRLRGIDYTTLHGIVIGQEGRETFERFGRYRLQEVNKILKGETTRLQSGLYSAIIEASEHRQKAAPAPSPRV